MRKRPDNILRNTTHGLSKVYPREYRSWKDMRGRINCPTDSDYKDYGGRGITICERWDDFAAFFADMGERPVGYTLDRIDVDGPYAPGNCRWADAKTQANNKRSNRKITWNGATKTLQQWCSEIGIAREKVRYRLNQGWSLEDAFNTTRDFRL